MNKILLYITLANLLFIAVYTAGTAGTGGVRTAGTGTAVDACQTGFYYTSTTGGDTCTACGAGSTANVNPAISGFTETGAPQATACISCVAGYKCTAPTPATGAGTLETVPTACPANEGSSAGQSACVSCGAGVATCTVTGTTVSAVLTCQSGFITKTVGGVKSCVAPTVAGCTVGTHDGTTETCTTCGATGYVGGAPSGTPAVCTKCTVAGCTVCGAAATCTTCGGDGFVAASSTANACVACAAGCKTCTASAATPPVLTCTACADGFFNSAAAGAAITCTACAAGCATCPDATKCTTVKKGWKLSAAAPATPVKCGGDGKTSTAAGSLACDVACTPTNCNTCNVDAAKCEVCKENFELAADACTAIAAADIHFTCKTTEQKNSADHCLTCDATVNFREIEKDTTVTPAVAKTVGKCLCKDGYVDVSTASTPKAVCEACGAGVKTCDAAKKALTCTNAAELAVGMVCKAKGATDVDGFYYDTSSSTFKACHATCAACNGGLITNCTKCYDAPPSWVEPTSLAANYPTYIKGTASLINATCFRECPTGFIANSARNSCVAGAATTGAAGGSASGVFAIISLIASLFLIF